MVTTTCAFHRKVLRLNDGPTLNSKVHEHVTCWEQSKLPQDIHHAVTTTLYKKKGEKSDWWNYQGITLLSITAILAAILLNRLVPTIAKENLPKASVASEQTEAQGTWCSFSRNCKKGATNKTKECMLCFNQGLWHHQQERPLADPPAPWLLSPLVPWDDDPTAWRPMQPDQTQQQPVSPSPSPMAWSRLVSKY